MIRLIYKGQSDFFFKEEVKINKFTDENIIEVIIKSEFENIEFEFKTSFIDENQALIRTSRIIEDYVKFFLFETEYEIRDLVCTELKYSIDSKVTKVIAPSTFKLKVDTYVLRELSNVSEYKRRLENFKSRDYTSYVNLFMNICDLEDVVGKYLMLYSILNSIFEKQKEVDKYIRKLEPKVVHRKTTNPNQSYEETIYSFLRNQIGHTSEKTDLVILNKEIRGNIDGLKNIVKEAIKSRK